MTATELIGKTVRIDRAHLIDPSNDTAKVIDAGLTGVSVSAWVQFPDGTENAFPVSALTVVDARRTELIEHADRLHQALWALATSELREVSSDFGHRDHWGPYNHVQEALIQVLTLIVGTRARAEELRNLMLDDSGEGVAYWLAQEAEAHEYELNSAHEEALRDVSSGQGYDDAVNGRPSRVDQAPDPEAYQDGWEDGCADYTPDELSGLPDNEPSIVPDRR